MYSGLNNKLSNVPTITGLSDVTADSVTTDTLIVDGNDVGSIIVQVPINTANITTLQQITTGQTYASVGDTTTFDNNVTLGAGKTMTADNFTGLASNSSQVLVTDNNTANTYYPTFASTGTGQKSLLFDISTTPLSYKPDTSLLQMGTFSTTENSIINNLFLGSKNSASMYATIGGAGMASLTTGDFNVMIGGSNVGGALAGGSNNFAMGYNAFTENINGGNNCVMGHRAAKNVGANGSFSNWYNTCVGDTTMTNGNDVAENTCVGAFAGQSMLNGNLGNTCIGIGADCADGIIYSTAIGRSAFCSASNTIQIGTSADSVIIDGDFKIKNNLILTTPATTLTQTELSYLDGVTSNIQAQINSISTGSFVTTNTIQTITAEKTFTGTTNLGVTNITGTCIFPAGSTTWINNNFLVSTNALGSATTLRLTTQGSQTFIQGGATSTSGTADIVFSSIYSSTAWVTMNNLGMTIAANNITLGAGNINFGAGAGSTNNLICGNTSAKSVVFTTGNNTIFGSSAGNGMTIAATSNTFIGSSAAASSTSSVQNVCVGANAGTGITSGLGANTFIGYNTGFQTANGTGSNNVCIGALSGTAMTTTAASNVMVGSLAGTALTTGVRNTLVGAGASDSIISGNDNTIVGQASGTMILTGLRNTIIGASSGNTITGNDNICIGSAADVPTAANSNQIVIGRVNETMYIQGGFNWRIGPQIVNTTTGTLNTAGFVLAQFYIVNMSAVTQTIALPNPTNAAYLGARVTFKRKGVTTPFLISSGGGIGFVPIGSITLLTSPITIAATTFQVDLVSDGINWCIIGQA